jgi:hypothetical protein
MKTFTQMVEEWEQRERTADVQRRQTTGTRWADDFHCWCLNQSVFRDGVWSTLTSLHQDFIIWNVPRDCDLSTFTSLLEEVGCYTETQAGILWCYGVCLPR